MALKAALIGIVIAFVGCGGTVRISDIGDESGVTSPYGEYYLRLTKIESCRETFSGFFFSPVGTQTDFILQVVSDLSNYYQLHPPKRGVLLAKFLFATAVIPEVLIKENKEFGATWTEDNLMTIRGFRGKFSENWGTVTFLDSTHLSDPLEGFLCSDVWDGTAKKIREFDTENISEE